MVQQHTQKRSNGQSRANSNTRKNDFWLENGRAKHIIHGSSVFVTIISFRAATTTTPHTSRSVGNQTLVALDEVAIARSVRTRTGEKAERRKGNKLTHSHSRAAKGFDSHSRHSELQQQQQQEQQRKQHEEQ